MPKVDRWARLTVRLPAETYHRLEALAEEIPGMTPNALIRLAVEQLTPQLEALAQALKAARSGQQGNALELLVALTQASRGAAQALPVGAEERRDEQDQPRERDLQEVLAQIQALQQEQGQRVQDVLDQPQGRGLRRSLERVQALQREQVQRVQQILEQPAEDLLGTLEWIQALQEEQGRWLHDVLAQPQGERLRQVLERVQALQREQGRQVLEALEQLRELQGQREQDEAGRNRFEAAAAFHQRWLDAGARDQQGLVKAETDKT